jgi:hypothetical protein
MEEVVVSPKTWIAAGAALGLLALERLYLSVRIRDVITTGISLAIFVICLPVMIDLIKKNIRDKNK